MKNIFNYSKQVLLPPYTRKDIPVLAVTVLTLLGLVLTVSVIRNDTNNQSNAASVNSVEPENGTLAGNVTVVNDSNASGGKYVKLGVAQSATDRSFSSWLWKSPKDLTVPEMQSYLSFAKSENIYTVYVDIDPYVSINAITDPTSRQQQADAFNTSVNTFITLAKGYNIKVQGLAGDMDWANSTHGYIPPMLVDYALNYNKLHPDAQFDGVHFDIEIYGLSDFSSNQVTYSTNYLNMINNLITKVNADSGAVTANFKLDFDIPFWFDEDGTIPAFTYNGNSKRLAYHILDLLNTMSSKGGQMAIMAYRNYADGTDGSIAISKNELNYAEASARNASVVVSQEVAPDSPAKVTFYGLSKTAFSTEATKINSAYQGYSTYKGIAIHDLVNYQSL